MVPILINHDHTKPIGTVVAVEGQLQVLFSEDVRITPAMADEIFGNAGLLVLEATEEDGVTLIRRGRIVEWSLLPDAWGRAELLDAYRQACADL